jgi:nitrite reductase/ring-hydroxylating ferredoxin subunit/ectoine hydroxylase-related dioxygenase (phytanoyl-CoA dioxygenase family)
VVDVAQIPAITDAVYRIVSGQAMHWAEKVVRDSLKVERPFYSERNPNVRFLVPHDLAAAHRRAYREFAKSRGQGKITPHGPHRDSWFDCPDNTINVWIAIGRVQTGNGLAIFPECHQTDLARTSSGAIATDTPLGSPVSFDLKPGDALVFHGDQVHASEINQTDSTRHVVSFRLTLDKPNFPNGHYHHYVYSAFKRTPLAPFAEFPARLAWSYLAYRFAWLGRRLGGLLRRDQKSTGAERSTNSMPGDESRSQRELTLGLADLPIGSIRPISPRICLARLGEDEIVAFGRYCPHEGADLAMGSLRGDKIVCPWHSLVIDPKTGASPCRSLAKLRTFETRVDGETVTLSAPREGG